ncbi:MAG: sulfite exporter TauE/SafE family protein [Oscillospiraceae bacterium]|nr:sulfite exporter TauE/SafE family protein [Oscillospiraceae bacterium]
MLAFFLVSLCASAVGAICGIGGGVIIKPVLDLFHLESVAAISFLSGCTVLSMSCYSVGRAMLAGEKRVSFSIGTPLAIGAAAGGLLGSRLFTAVRDMFADPNAVGSVQAACLAVVTAGTLAYTICKARIPTHRIQNKAACLMIGLVLGCMSSFLGIGGGPINLVVLYFFFSMETKTAAANSLYIILFSQLANLLSNIIAGSVPAFQPLTLALMAAGGIGGGMIGRSLNKRMDDQAVDKLFIALMAVIIGISIMNSIRYAL